MSPFASTLLVHAPAPCPICAALPGELCDSHWHSRTCTPDIHLLEMGIPHRGSRACGLGGGGLRGLR